MEYPPLIIRETKRGIQLILSGTELKNVVSFSVEIEPNGQKLLAVKLPISTVVVDKELP